MAAKPCIAILGAGNLGSALAVSLGRAGYTIEAVVARSGAASLKKAQRLAKEVGACAIGSSIAGLRAELIWFCVPDSEIARAARSLSQTPRPFDRLRAGSRAKNVRRTDPEFDWTARIALHSSGVLASDELTILRERGAAVASVHPMMTFVRGSRPSLSGVSFAIEGDRTAVRLARRIVKDLGGHAFPILKKHKAAYHAWGTFASPLFTALLATTEQFAATAGVARTEAKRRMIPILLQTLANYAAFDAGGAFSGPIVRGDVDTVKRHLRVLADTPAAREVYTALARAALLYLPAKKKNELRKILASRAI